VLRPVDPDDDAASIALGSLRATGGGTSHQCPLSLGG
jgi:hypothetical protein